MGKMQMTLSTARRPPAVIPQAFVALVKREQEEAERARKKEEEEKKKQREEQQRRKRMLEAAFEGDLEEMKAVLKEVADLDTKSGVGTDEKGKLVRLQHLLNMVDCTDANGNTPLSEASGGGHPEAIRMLIENGGHPNSRDVIMIGTSGGTSIEDGLESTIMCSFDSCSTCWKAPNGARTALEGW